MMNGHIQSVMTAKVLSFPSGGRDGLVRSVRRDAIENDNRVKQFVIYDGWYHQAAMDEERGKNA